MRPPLYVVLHLYKTAGKTLLSVFQQNFGRKQVLSMYAPQIGLDKAEASANPGWNEAQVLDYLAARLNDSVRCAFGHMSFYGMHELPQLAGREVRYIVFLREPVARVVSLYNYLLHHSKNAWHQEIVDNGWSLEEWFHQSQGLWLHNGQLRQLLLWSQKEALAQRYLTGQHLDAGKKALEAMWFIGATETFAADLQMLSHLLGFSPGAKPAVVNASRGEKAIAESVTRLIREDNALDGELYAHALALRAAGYDGRMAQNDPHPALAAPAPTASASRSLTSFFRLPRR